jgi:hypothetical protein
MVETASYYFPLLILIVYNILAYKKIIDFANTHSVGENEIEYLKRYRSYPYILALAETLPIAHRVLEIFGWRLPFIFGIVSSLLVSLVGLFNALIYGLIYNVRVVIQARICCCLPCLRVKDEIVNEILMVDQENYIVINERSESTISDFVYKPYHVRLDSDSDGN